MSKPRIICIGGHARNGKDTIAIFLKDKYEAQGKKVLHINLGNYVKFVASSYFNWNGEKDEIGRTILQQVGTEIVRSKNPDFWVNTVIEFIKVFDDFDYIIIPDVRFSNEITKLIDENYDVTSIRVTKLNGKSNLTLKQLQHISETEMDNYRFDYYIEAENLEELEFKVEQFMDYIETDIQMSKERNE